MIPWRQPIPPERPKRSSNSPQPSAAVRNNPQPPASARPYNPYPFSLTQKASVYLGIIAMLAGGLSFFLMIGSDGPLDVIKCGFLMLCSALWLLISILAYWLPEICNLLWKPPVPTQ